MPRVAGFPPTLEDQLTTDQFEYPTCGGWQNLSTYTSESNKPPTCMKMVPQKNYVEVISQGDAKR